MKNLDSKSLAVNQLKTGLCCSGQTVIGLFQGMFESNIIAFNPGWDQYVNTLESFDDGREIQKDLKSKCVLIAEEADHANMGPASLTLTDPDGNLILIDQDM
jgi:hypothetical protein